MEVKLNICKIEKDFTPEGNGIYLFQSRYQHKNTKWSSIWVLFKSYSCIILNSIFEVEKYKSKYKL